MPSDLGPGDPAPGFEALTTDGKTIRLGDYRGRHLIVYFFPKAGARWVPSEQSAGAVRLRLASAGGAAAPTRVHLTSPRT